MWEKATGHEIAKVHAHTPGVFNVVFSPDGRKIAYVRRVRQGDAWYNQIFVTMLKKSPPAP